MHTIVTHNGTFHPDDVFSVALLQLLLGIDQVRVVRSRDESVIEAADWVVDVGAVYDPAKQRFDHHQPDAPVRASGIPYSALGLLWQHYGAELAESAAVATEVEQQLVVPIDANDNGVDLYTVVDAYDVQPYELHDVISAYKPVWGSDEAADQQFTQAVAVARTLLARLLQKARARVEMRTYIAEVYAASANKRVLVFETPVSAREVILYPDVDVIVQPDTPHESSRWHAEAVRQTADSFTPRVRFPRSWAGLRGVELQRVSDLPDAVFCHVQRFFFVAASKASVLQAVAQTERVVDQDEK